MNIINMVQSKQFLNLATLIDTNKLMKRQEVSYVTSRIKIKKRKPQFNNSTHSLYLRWIIHLYLFCILHTFSIQNKEIESLTSFSIIPQICIYLLTFNSSQNCRLENIRYSESVIQMLTESAIYLQTRVLSINPRK